MLEFAVSACRRAYNQRAVRHRLSHSLVRFGTSQYF
jgi:uncharacterized protein YdiU (UPF0061 family)